MSNNNNNSNSNNTNQPGLDALAALYNSIGASNQDGMRHPAAAAQALASLASQSIAPAAGSTTSQSPFVQSIYAQQVQQQLTAAQQHQQQQQQVQNQALLKSIPTELLQAYLASTAPQSQSLSGSLPNNNAQQVPQQQPQPNPRLLAQAQQIAAQLMASTQANQDAQQRLSSFPNNNISSMLLQGDLVGSIARDGSTNGVSQARSHPDPGVVKREQAAQTGVAKPDPSSKPKVPPAKAPSNLPKKRLMNGPASVPAQPVMKQPNQMPNVAKGQAVDEKKLAKRAANRISAHLSRKRKKMYIDDVTSENADLRRKVQILQSIPDLIVVFNSSGCISFVSQSVPDFLDMADQELEGTIFWDYLTADSVNLIKSAFMDALAVKRNPEDDSTVLCNGESLMVKLIDKDGGEPITASMKGVVHFTDNAPECISSMRPLASPSSSPDGLSQAEVTKATKMNGRSRDVSDVESRKTVTESSNDGSDVEVESK